MSINPLPTTGNQLVTTGGSNSAVQTLAATTTAIRRLLTLTLQNQGTNTGALRLYAGTASTGTLLASARLTSGQYSSQHFEFGSKGRDIAAGLYVLGSLGTVRAVYSYINE